MNCSLFKFTLVLKSVCPSVLETAALRAPTHYLKDFPLLSVGCSAANVACGDFEKLRTKMFT
jgi:hypothetical protein